MLQARLVAHELFQHLTERWVAHSARIEPKCRCVKPILSKNTKWFVINKTAKNPPVPPPPAWLEKPDKFFAEPKTLSRTKIPRFVPGAAVETGVGGSDGEGTARGAAAREVQPGATPALVVEENGRAETIAARLVVGAEGRSSVVRSSACFPVLHDPEDMMIAGVLFENVPASEDTGELIYHFGKGQFVGVFPQGGGRVRMYLCYHAATQPRFQGHADLPRFIEGCQNAGANPAYFKDARATGPLATFNAAHTWVAHPYREGVALLGDAAASSDPTWGQGLSLTLRDVRVLRDHLLSSTDWDAAGHAYAAEHDGYANRLHTFNQWFGEFFLAVGPEADARRARAFPLIGEDPSRQPDSLFVGPDMPADEAVRKRFFAEA